jgi:5-methylcytosine-specific restriction protein B
MASPRKDIPAMPDFESAVAQFTYTEEERVKGETLRQQFLERFPASSLPTMTLEKYSLGLESKENSFCYWLEFKTRELGSIGGAPASKHVIFYSQERKEYSFPSQYQTKKEAFDAVKSGLLELLRLGAADKFDQCAGVPPFENMNLIRGKVLNMYFPDKFLPIFSLDHLKDFCLQLGVKADFQSQNAMNQALLKFKQQNPLVNGWSNDKFATLLYQKLSPTVQFWKVAPGENAAFWSECYQEGFICVGWKELGDMRQQSEEAAFKEKYREVYGTQRIRQWKEIWAFAKQIKKGDVIVANNGLKSIVGIGTVTGDYWYNENREQYKHCLPIKWDVTTEFPVPDSARDVVADWFQGTVKKISREEYNLLLAGGTASREHQERFPPLPADSRYAQICKTTFLPEKFFADCERLLKIKQQIILQGAPGTGKTFVAEKVAALWAEDSKRVKVVQFHESFGYEDFIYGIKP